MSRASIRNTAAWHPPRLTPHGFVVNGRLMNSVEAFETRLAQRALVVEQELDRLLDAKIQPGEIARPAKLLSAMRHGVLNGGKRLRPFLLLESASLFGANEQAALRVGAALECVHCYSLIHDDLPDMDNDRLRRGRPSVWAAFDPATAILEVAVHKGFHALDAVPHVVTRLRIPDPSIIHVVDPEGVPNPNWLRPGWPGAAQQAFGRDLLERHPFVVIPSVVSSKSWNLLFHPRRAAGHYDVVSQERFALDSRLGRG